MRQDDDEKQMTKRSVIVDRRQCLPTKGVKMRIKKRLYNDGFDVDVGVGIGHPCVA